MITQLIGDCRETLKTLDAGSVQCVVTSPPYFGLRDYGSARWDGGDAAFDHSGTDAGSTSKREGRSYQQGHPMGLVCRKCGAVRIDQQIGLEQSPAEYVAALVAVFGEVWRVLRDDGTVWLNLGDSYNSPMGGATNPGISQKGTRVPTYQHGQGYRKDKTLKPKDLIGIPWRVAFALQDAGWYLRSDIIWAKPNCMPESVTDRPTRSHEYLFLLTKRDRYYYDSEAIAEPTTHTGLTWEQRKAQGEGPRRGIAQGGLSNIGGNDGKRNRRTVWTVPTSPYSGAHFATFPEKLIEPCILAGSRVGDTVLDPFGGSGTTARVAIKHGRHAILCELNPDYVKLQDKRTDGVQLALQVE